MPIRPHSAPPMLHLAAATPLALLSLTACHVVLPSKGGGQISSAKRTAPRFTDPAAVALPPGYRIEVIAEQLNFPTAVTFDDQNRVFVTEAGYSYGEVFTTPRLLRVEPRGAVTEIAHGQPQQDGPWTGVTFYRGNFYVADGGELHGGRILRIAPNGQTTPLIDNLPSMGDHHTNGPAIGPDGKLYFSVGTATNSGVVGPDDAQFGWLRRHPDFHDIPARDITLAGENFTSENPLQPGTVVTGAYSPFGTPSAPGQIVKGQLPANGAVMRIPLDATPENPRVELVAWGMRNPFGLCFTPQGQLLVSENSYDVRGSRPVWGAGDLLWAINPAESPRWFGWPDFFATEPLTNEDWFQPTGKPPLHFLLASHPNPPQQPAAIFAVHASATRLDVARSETFGYRGQAFVALFGDMAPTVGKVLAPVGFMVVRADPATGVIEPFALNRGKGSGTPFGPASRMEDPRARGGLERPIDAHFSPDGNALYVVDFGIVAMSEKGAQPVQNSGVLWRITREGPP